MFSLDFIVAAAKTWIGLLNQQKYQLQRTEVIDMMNSRRYKGEDAKRWRSLAGQRDFAKKTASAYTQEMGAIVKAFVATHPDWEADEIKLTVKVIE